nr:amidohydrolase [Nocardioides sp. zg-1308]
MVIPWTLAGDRWAVPVREGGSDVRTTVFTNAAVFDGTSYRGRVGDVVVDAGRVVAVGPDLAPAGAAVVDVAGGLLLPGFTDAHVHPVQGGLERLGCDLSGLPADAAAYVAHVAAHAAAHPDQEWVQGGGWAMAAFPGGLPTASALDEAVGPRPVALANRDHHGMWVSSRALELAGITAATADPADGRIERDEHGQPTGMLHEGAMDLLAGVLPPADDAQLHAALLEGQRHLHSLGVTGWQDAIIGAYSGMRDAGPTYARAAAGGDLTGSVVGALWWDRERGAEQVAELVARREAYSVGRFAATAVKIMQDGVAENGTAALVEPYLDRCGHATRNTGISFVDPRELRGHVAALDAHGFQVHVHGLGDRAVREALDALDGTDPRRRHHVAHLQLVHPADVPRFGALGVAANIQALWACHDDQMTELTIPFLGEERARRQYPFADLHAAGARLVAGSDWPVSTPDPLAAIHTAVHRTSYDEPGPAGTDPFHPEQALDVEVAFAAYTSGSAWVNHRDDAGRIAPGAVADLVVLDRDPFTARHEIGAARVRSTWIDGTCVHEA